MPIGVQQLKPHIQAKQVHCSIEFAALCIAGLFLAWINTMSHTDALDKLSTWPCVKGLIKLRFYWKRTE